MRNNYPPFYLVWNPNGRAPSRRHPSRAAASLEAERLARANPGQEFYVLVPLSLVTKNDIVRTTFDVSADEILF
jgi:hypothetical protein